MEGVLVVISGFSGSGKGTMVQRLLQKYPDRYALSISATTRSPREGEQEGVHYFYRSTQEFEAMIAADELIEYAKFVDNYYGTPRAYVEKQLLAGKSVILEIEIQGALQVKEKFPDTKLVFITPPSARELKRRLIGRGTETEKVIEQRLHRAVEEASYMKKYDYLIVNDELEIAVEQFHQIIEAERSNQTEENAYLRVSANLDFIQKIQEDLELFVN